jgi:tetratricopeptide (TPR) repeat protein
MTVARIVSILAALVALAAPARAEDKTAAHKAYLEGTEYYNSGRYAEALESFKRGYESYEGPGFLYNIAQCQRALGHAKEAVESYRSYLGKSSADAPDRAEVEKLIAELQREIDVPAPTLAPTPAASTAIATPAPPRPTRPAWKRGWVWGVVGGVVLAGIAAGVGVALGTEAHPPKADARVGF